MTTSLDAVAILVPDYDVALAYFVGQLGFELVCDTVLSSEDPSAQKRWVLVHPPGGGTALLLARAATEIQAAAVGNQAGGRVFLFLATDDFAADHARMVVAGVNFLEPPRDEPYGRVAVFSDPFGNRWDLVERHVTRQSQT